VTNVIKKANNKYDTKYDYKCTKLIGRLLIFISFLRAFLYKDIRYSIL
jgi:hypothetical protein